MKVRDRDLRILKFGLEQKFLTLLQIAKKFFSESRDILHRPMKRVCELVEAGLLRVERPNVSDKRFYVVTPEGVKLLNKHNLAGGLRAIKEIDYRTFEHDEWVTNVRIIFEELLDLHDWVPERAFKKGNVKKKVPDGWIPYDGGNLIVEVEKTLKNKRYYERVFADACIPDHKDDVFLYITAKEADKQWLMKQADGWELIYFATMDELTNMQSKMRFRNSQGHEFKLRRQYLGGVHFNVPKGNNFSGDGGLEAIYKGERKYKQINAECRKLRAQGLSEEEIDKLLGD